MASSRIIAEIYTQADTSELERAEKLLKDYNNELEKGGKQGANAYKSLLSTYDKLLLKQQQLKKQVLFASDAKTVNGLNKELEITNKKLKDLGQKNQVRLLAKDLGEASMKAKQLEKSLKLDAKKGISDQNANAALLGSLGGGLSGLGGGIGGLIGGPLGGVIGQGIGEATQALIDFGKESLNAYADFVRFQSQIETFATGDAKALQSALQKFASENPIANYADSVEGAVTLLREGFSDKQAFDSLKQITEVAGGSKRNFDGIVRALSQVKSAGRLMGEELNQLRDAGFNPLIELQKTAKFAGKDLRAEMEKGNITFQDVANTLKAATSEGGRFFGQSEKLAKTYAGSLANLEDATTNLKTAFGKLLAENGVTDFNIGLTNIIRAVTLFVQSDAFDDFLSIIDKTSAFLAPGLNAAAKGIAAAFSAVSSASAKFVEEESKKRELAQKKTEASALKFVKRMQEVGKLPKGDPQQFLNVEGAFMQGEELENAIKAAQTKATQISKEEQKKRDKLAKEAEEKRKEQEKETTEKLKQALIDRNEQLLSLKDKIALQGLSDTPKDIQERYKIELDAEIRGIEANKERIKKEIEATTKEQEELKAKLLASYDKEAEAVRELYAKREKKDITDANKEIKEATERLYKDIDNLRRENQKDVLELVGETYRKELFLVNENQLERQNAINEDYAAQKKAIQDSKALQEEKKVLFEKLEVERQTALSNLAIKSGRERIAINDKYFELELQQMQDAFSQEKIAQDFAFRQKKIDLDAKYNAGILSAREYFAELKKLQDSQRGKDFAVQAQNLQNELSILNDAINNNTVFDKNGTRQILSKEEIEALKKRKQEVQNEIVDLGLKINESQNQSALEIKDTNKEKLLAALDFANNIAQIASDALGQIFEAQIAEIDNILSVQQSRLENARALAEAGFTGLIQQEQDKLEVLQQQREQAVRRQLILDNISRISSQVLAVANAIAGASNPPTPATPFLIAAAAASALATIGASIASARGFATGTTYLQPENGSQGRKVDDIPIMANKGEGIIPTAQNVRYNKLTGAMIEGTPLALAKAALSYPDVKKMLLRELNYNFGAVPNIQAATIAQNNDIKSTVSTLTNALGGITVINESTNISFDENGVHKRQTIREKRLRDIRNKV